MVGVIGKLACGDVHLYEIDRDFQPLNPPFPLRELPPDVINDLSTDQNYGYRICQTITTGIIDEDLLRMKVGPVSHSHWVTTADRICRVYISKHGLTGEDLKKLRVIVPFIVSHYYPLWFDIKAESKISFAPRHILKEIAIVRSMKAKDVLSKKVKSIAMQFIEKGAWQAHSEPLLLSLLSSGDVEDRRFGISKILSIRNGATLGCREIREVFAPKLNWEARSIRELHKWENPTEPLQTSSTSSTDIWRYLDTPLQLPLVPCHAQSCERCVKEVTIASSSVFGLERRDGWIRAKISSRSLMPLNETKGDLAQLIPNDRNS